MFPTFDDKKSMDDSDSGKEMQIVNKVEKDVQIAVLDSVRFG